MKNHYYHYHFLCWGVIFVSCIFPTYLLSQIENSSPLSINLNDVSLQDAFQIISRQYPVRFFYNPNTLPPQKISESFIDASLDEVLTTILKGTGLDYTYYGASEVVIALASELGQELTNKPAFASTQNTDQSDIEYTLLGDSTQLVDTDRRIVLQGRVIDTANGKAVSGATIRIVDRSFGSVTDQDGFYRMEMTPGTYELVLEATGYANIYENIKIFSTATFDISPDLRSYRIDEVLLEAQADDQNISSTDIGLDRLSIKQIQRMPAFMGEIDVVKSIVMLPGVNTVGEGASGFNVRGGTIDQNLILQDESPFFNSSHLLGFFSVFNSDLVQSVDLYKGHIPAQYGGRIASVLDVTLKDGDFQQFGARGGIGPVTSKATIEGPLVYDKVSYILGARSTYSDWVLSLASDLDVKESKAFYYDLNGKITARISDKSILSASGYSSFDRFQFSDQYGYDWQTRIGNLNYRHIFSDRFSSSTYLIKGDYQSSYFDPEGQDAFTLENGMDYYRIKQQFLLQLPFRQTVRVGGVLSGYEALPETQSPRGSDSGILRVEVPKDKGREWAFFLNDDIELNDRISLSLGIRYARFQYLGPDQVLQYASDRPRSSFSVVDTTSFGDGSVIETYDGWEPRAALRIAVDEHSSVKVSYNRMQQYIHLISNTMAATPVDIWQVSTNHIPPQLANNYSIGYFRNFDANNWETSLELYYKDIPQLVEYKDIPELLLNPFLESELLVGEGQIYGGELYIKKVRGIMTGWLSYTYSRSLRRVQGQFPEEVINEGDWYPANFDQPHQINMATIFRLNKQHTVSFNFTYSTGRPITAPIADYQVGNVIIPHYTERNQLRIPDYHRLDFSYTLEPNIIKRKRLKNTITFSIYNLYFRKNAFSIFYERRNDRFIPDAFRLAVLGTAFPSITYNFRF